MTDIEDRLEMVAMENYTLKNENERLRAECIFQKEYAAQSNAKVERLRAAYDNTRDELKTIIADNERLRAEQDRLDNIYKASIASHVEEINKLRAELKEKS